MCCWHAWWKTYFIYPEIHIFSGGLLYTMIVVPDQDEVIYCKWVSSWIIPLYNDTSCEFKANGGRKYVRHRTEQGYSLAWPDIKDKSWCLFQVNAITWPSKMAPVRLYKWSQISKLLICDDKNTSDNFFPNQPACQLTLGHTSFVDQNTCQEYFCFNRFKLNTLYILLKGRW